MPDQGPYRAATFTAAPAPRWWAGGAAYAGLGLAALLWALTGAAGYASERDGVAASFFALPATAFAVGCWLVARRTRYAPDVSRRLLAPLATGLTAAFGTFVLLTGFYGFVWGLL